MSPTIKFPLSPKLSGGKIPVKLNFAVLRYPSTLLNIELVGRNPPLRSSLSYHHHLSPVKSVQSNGGFQHFPLCWPGKWAQRLTLIDFAQLLDPCWKAPSERESGHPIAATKSTLTEIGKSIFYFVEGGIAGAFGATMVYPIDLGMLRSSP